MRLEEFEKTLRGHKTLEEISENLMESPHFCTYGSPALKRDKV
jgi:hypothetical protein